jgi:hypothetical protein
VTNPVVVVDVIGIVVVIVLIIAIRDPHLPFGIPVRKALLLEAASLPLSNSSHRLIKALSLTFLIIEAGRTICLCCSSEASSPLTNTSPSPSMLMLIGDADADTDC